MSPAVAIRWLTTAAVVVALFTPVIRDQDSFPLSTQPMYASARDRIDILASARGVDGRTGEQIRLSMGLVAATDDPLIAQSRLRRAISSGTAEALCVEIAGRVAVRSDLRGVNLIEIIGERLDLVEFVTEDAEPLDREVHARCPVTR